MKPSQRVYQQRDIAKNQMDKYAHYIATNASHIHDEDKELSEDQFDGMVELLDKYVTKFDMWRTAYRTLEEVAAETAREERHSKVKQAHREYVAQNSEVIEVIGEVMPKNFMTVESKI